MTAARSNAASLESYDYMIPDWQRREVMHWVTLSPAGKDGHHDTDRSASSRF